MKKTGLILATMLASLALTSATFAGMRSNAFSVSPFLGGYTFDGTQQISTGPLYGLRLGYNLTKAIGLEGVGSFVHTDGTQQSNNIDAYNYRLEGLYNFMTDSNFVPFVAVGGGGTTVDYSAAGLKDTTKAVAGYGAGIRYFFTEDWALRGDVRHLIVFDKTRSNLEYGIGLSYLFGGKKPAPAPVVVPPPPPKPAPVVVKDTDGDGVPDSLDKCPDTPKGVKVDKDGCPIDTDGDGVPDYLDKCPDTPKGVTVDSNGCPIDTDGDGVPDYLDKCPGTAKGVTVDSNGCPVDTDGDGVPDYLDKCPGTPNGVKVDMNGCPVDTDGDGVPDYLDKCPNTPKGAEVDKNGCSQKVCITLKVNFDFDKADIKPEFHDEIKKVSDFMTEYPSATAVIEGHTDSLGTDAYNQKLSARRAAAVKNYLTEKLGIAASRLSSKGYGESKPIATNKTEEGRAINRRVDAVIDCGIKMKKK